MAAQDLNVFPVVFDPQIDDNSPGTQLNGSLGFQLHAGNVTQTLLANNPYNDGTIEAILYYPNPPASAACDNATRSLVPQNLTNEELVPPGGIPSMGLAPWTSIDCVQAFLTRMRLDGVKGAIFYQNSTSTTTPPSVSDPIWNLKDGGKWKSEITFPVYALPGAVGAHLMTQLARYSGNITQVPYGNQLAQQFDSSDIVRLQVTMDIDYTTGIPSLWVFLIIVLAILFTVVLATSVVMHLIQRRQRRDLQRRVANGEVDLEALGIKQLRVTQELLDKMPQYTYTSKSEMQTTQGAKNFTVTREVPFSQRTCPICLDDFEHGVTNVRELHCNHIFHPECIDPFLRDNSSLCPMCKKSTLPAGYCPVRVTNLMVRRERLIRRMRQRQTADRIRESGIDPNRGRLPSAFQAVQRRVHRLSTPGAEFSHAPRNRSTAAESGSNELQTRTTATATADSPEDLPPPEVQAQGTAARRAWRRERIARQQARNYNAQATEALEVDISRPLWRRIAGRVIPSLE